MKAKYLLLHGFGFHIAYAESSKKSLKKTKRLENFLKGFDIQSVIVVFSRMHAMFF